MPITVSTLLSPDKLASPPDQRRSAVTWRSVLLGLGGVCFICGLTVYNDYVVENTFMVGNFLPIGLLLFFLLFIFLFNAPLWKWAPRWALSAGELAVALGMTLVSCCLPSSGLMRYLPANLVGIYHYAGVDASWRQTLVDQVNPPDWLFPKFQTKNVMDRGTVDPVISDYWSRADVKPADDNFLGHLRAVPWSKWALPAAAWGVFLIGMYGAILCASVIFRKQWSENERLAFPLASVYLSLIDTPPPGRAFNDLFRAPRFWIAFGFVFLIHLIRGLHVYLPDYVPDLPIGFQMWDIYGKPPWAYTEYGFKGAQIYFCVIGVTFFISSSVAFSLWFFYLLKQAALMIMGTYQYEFTPGMEQDQLLGALVPFVLAGLWVGRKHWALVIRQMMSGEDKEEPRGRYLSYAVAGWGFVICVAIMGVWMKLAGISFLGIFVILSMLGMMFLAVARIVAETGLVFVQLPLPFFRPLKILALDVGKSISVNTRTFFFTSWFHTLFGHDLRECLPVYSTHALRVADEAAYEKGAWRRGGMFFAALVLALVVGYFVSGSSMLYCEYKYASTLGIPSKSPINNYGVFDSLHGQVFGPTQSYAQPGHAGLAEPHNSLFQLGIGFAASALLAILRMRYAAWPLHPLGYILAWGPNYPMQRIWFSIIIGWLAKTLIVKFGGAGMFKQARSFFIGLIVGEAAAAALWLIVSLVLLSMGRTYHAIQLLPT
jgi:hypothetical protein